MKANGGCSLPSTDSRGRGSAGSQNGKDKEKSSSLAPPGVSGGASDRGNGSGAGANGGVSSRSSVDKSGSPYWMRRLEERWQKLHRKINAPSPVNFSDRWATKRQHTRREVKITRPASSQALEGKILPVRKQGCSGVDRGSCRSSDRSGAATPDPCPREIVSESQFLLVNLSEPRSLAKCGFCASRATKCDHSTVEPTQVEQSSLTDLDHGAQLAPDTYLTETRSAVEHGSRCSNGASSTSDTTVEEAADDAKGDVIDARVVGDNEVASRNVNEGGMNVGRGEMEDEVGGRVREIANLQARADVNGNPLAGTKSRAVAMKSPTGDLGGKETARKHEGWKQGRRGATRREGMRVFAHMSMEARHAVTETLQEMRASDPGQTDGDLDEDINDVNDEAVCDPSRLDSCSGEADLKAQRVSSASSRDQASTRNQTPARNQSSSRDQTSRDQNSIGDQIPIRHRSTHVPAEQRPLVKKPGDRAGAQVGGGQGGKSPRNSQKMTSVRASTRVPSKAAKEDATSSRDIKPGVACGRDVKAEMTYNRDITIEEVEEAGDPELLSLASADPLSLLPPVTFDPSRLPTISSRTEKHLHGRLHGARGQLQYRIRGIGSYRVSRERTFEITAPDFDIRYREVITCQKGDRDTPPPDIFEQSVNKVKGWLTKYHTPR